MLLPRSGADISGDGLYRYELWRQWGKGDVMVWVMLNPSTANADTDDPTIRRCTYFAKREGYSGISVVNLFALRATNPKVLRIHPEPEGSENLQKVRAVLDFFHRSPIVAAWGSWIPRQPCETLDYVMAQKNLFCLGVSKSGSPRHPLYLRNDTRLGLLQTERQLAGV
jgi:hypothetical protein